VFANSGSARLGGERLVFKNGVTCVAFVFANSSRARLGGERLVFKNGFI
jgi:hypothetical protein